SSWPQCTFDERDVHCHIAATWGPGNVAELDGPELQRRREQDDVGVDRVDARSAHPPDAAGGLDALDRRAQSQVSLGAVQQPHRDGRVALTHAAESAAAETGANQ